MTDLAHKAKKTAKVKKVLFVLDHFHPYLGGAESLFLMLTTALVAHGFEVVVVTTRFDRQLPEEETYKGVKIIRVNGSNRFVFTVLSIPKVYRQAKTADFIHTTTYNAAFPAAIVGKWLRKPVFITFHEVWGDLWGHLPFISFFQKTAFSLFEKMLLYLPFDKFIAVSDFTKRELIEQGIPEQKIVRIYNGMDYTGFEGHRHRPPKRFTFTFFGRLGISKGINLLIPGAAQFLKKYPNSLFKLIIPTYPKSLFRTVMDLVDAHGIKPYIELHHNLSRTELFEEILTSSCVVIASYSEGFCFAATETVALGVPIISSQQGALAETVSGKYIALREMSTEALSEALEKAYRHEWSEKPIRYFQLKASLNAYMGLYLY